MYRLRFRAAIAAIVLLAALICLLPGLLAPNLADVPRIRLGLDLRGGVQLTLGVDTGKAIQAALLSEGQRLRQLAADEHLLILGPRMGTGNVPELLIPNKAQEEALLELIHSKAPDLAVSSPIDGPDGTLRLPLAFTPAYEKQTAELAVNQVLKTISSRIDQFGVAEPDIRKQAGDRILIQLPGLNDVQRAVQLIGQTARLSFHLVRDDIQPGAVLPPGVIRLPMKDGGGSLILDKAPLLGGELVTDARPAFAQQGEPLVSLSFNPQGAEIFATVTGENKHKRLAIVLDDTVHSAPVIQDKITGGSATITGRFTVDEAQDLAIALRSGSLAAPVQVLEERTVGPALGEASIKGGLIAALLGAIAVVILMPLRYGWSGVLADGLLCITLLLLMAGMAAIGATLTLPGIAGIVLTIGMAVDANVLIFERIREEIHLGLAPRQSISAGFARANLAITDSNLTTILVAVILYQFGTGPVRGFAVTLILGIIASMYTAISLCRIAYEIWLRKSHEQKALSISGLFHGQAIIKALGAFPYLKHARKAVMVALVLVVAAGAMLISTGGPHYGVDFAGGAAAQVSFNQPVHDNAIHAALKPLGLEGVSLQATGENSWQIRFALPGHIAAQDLSKSVINALQAAFPDAGAQLVSMESVGPKVGDDLRNSALEAIYYAVLLITVYISGRFEHRWGTAVMLAVLLYAGMFAAGWLGLSILWRMVIALALTFALCWKLRLGFAVGAAASLCFTVTVTICLLVLLGEEFDLNIVAALLTIIGYSLNDTIVIYDRIRETLRLEPESKPQPIGIVIQNSLADTMSRTLMTGGTTLVSALALFLFGGQIIHGFALTMLIGVSVGTLSSLFIASPLLPLFGDTATLRQAVTPAVYVRPDEGGVV